MSGVRDRLAQAWAVLQTPPVEEFSSYRLDIEGFPGEIRAAIDRDGLQHVLIAGEHATAPASRPGVLAVSLRPLVFAGVSRRFLDVCCTDPALERQFRELAVDLVESCVVAPDPVDATLTVVARWRRLLATLWGGLDENARLGLFAELSVLAAFNTGPHHLPAAAWTGPLRAQHDFELEDRCLEVKAHGPAAAAIHVHGEDQLDGHHARPLHLVLVPVVADENGRTITDLVEQLRAALPGDPVLAERLAATGADFTHPAITGQAYGSGPVIVVDVDEDTPRLVPGSFATGALPPGVSRVRYDLDLPVLQTSGRPVALSELPTHLRGGRA